MPEHTYAKFAIGGTVIGLSVNGSALADCVTVAVLAPVYPPAFRGGGPARTLEALTAAAPVRYSARVFAPDRDMGDPARLPVTSNAWSDTKLTPTYFASVDSLAELIRMYAQVRRFKPDVVYLNSLFNLKLAILPRILVAVRYWQPVALLHAPRGELDPGALRIRSRKKRAFLGIYRALRLERGTIWHASSQAESAAIERVWGDQVQVLIRENETSLPQAAIEPEPHAGPLRAIFVSRLSAKKGLLTALQALQNVTSSVDFDVFGPEEDPTYVAACRRAAVDVPAQVTVRFCGLLAPQAVRETMAGYDVMIFPTAGENFGHVIAESLSASCPVATTDTTPWSDILRLGGGEVIYPSSVETWSAAIERLASLSVDERHGLRVAAGGAYVRWRSRRSEPHVFELLSDHLEGSMYALASEPAVGHALED